MAWRVLSPKNDFFDPWEVVATWPTHDEAYADLMWRKDLGESGLIIEEGK